MFKLLRMKKLRSRATGLGLRINQSLKVQADQDNTRNKPCPNSYPRSQIPEPQTWLSFPKCIAKQTILSSNAKNIHKAHPYT